MRVLAAILAGGKSRRFGSDKALVPIGGARMIDVVARALLAQAAALVVCGREDDAYTCVCDRPEAGLGPLGGLSGALHHAAENGFDAVLSSGCDSPGLPHDLLEQLRGPGASFVASQPVIGLWPVAVAGELDAYLAEGGRAIRGFTDRIGARAVEIEPPIANINRPEDLSPRLK